MMAGTALDLLLAAAVVVVATWSTLARQTFAAIAAFIAYGLLLALAWVRLAAVDVALAEAAIGGGLAGVLLLGAAARLRRLKALTPDRPPPLQRLAVALLCAGVSGVLVAVVAALPEPTPSLASAAAANLSALGVGNPVTAVLIGYRALDTLLETIVVVLALIGVWSLAPDRLWGGVPWPWQAGSDEMLGHVARLMPPIGIVVAIYVVWVGSDAPGGKFQGASILAAMWILVMMAGLKGPPAVVRRGPRFLLVLGPAAFLAIGVAGLLVADGFLAYPPSYAKPLILAVEFVLAPSLALTLGLLVAGPPARAAGP